MKEITVTNTLFDAAKPGDAICVTTNGILRHDGRAVMGADIAKAADTRFDLAGILGKSLMTIGNHAAFLKKCGGVAIFSFPTKNHWRDASDIKLIQRSAKELVQLKESFLVRSCYLPRPGCGCGGLDWPDVKAVLEPILDDSFIIVTSSRYDK